MNIMGKILVILNLLFALIVGGFLVVDFATRTNWRVGYLKLQDEMKVAEINWKTVPESLSKLETANKKLTQERDTARQEVLDGQDLLKAKELAHKIALDAAKLSAEDAQLTMQKFLGEKERLNKENQALLVVLKSRDEKIVELTANVTKYRNAAVAQESAFKIAQDRLGQALERNAQLEQTIAKGKTGGADTPVVRGQANPPTVYVEGKIEKIHTEDTNLVQLTVGSDKGLLKNQTLEVFRLDPPLYLGMIRIVDVTPHQAVGRLERAGAANRTPLRVGDAVASTLTRN